MLAAVDRNASIHMVNINSGTKIVRWYPGEGQKLLPPPRLLLISNFDQITAVAYCFFDPFYSEHVYGVNHA